MKWIQRWLLRKLGVSINSLGIWWNQPAGSTRLWSWNRLWMFVGNGHSRMRRPTNAEREGSIGTRSRNLNQSVAASAYASAGKWSDRSPRADHVPVKQKRPNEAN